MTRKRPETNRSKIAKMLIEEYDRKTAGDIQDALKDLLRDTLENILKAELYDHLDYEYGEAPLSLNTRNGTTKKNLKNSYGEIGIEILSDRESSNIHVCKRDDYKRYIKTYTRNLRVWNFRKYRF